MSEPGQCPSCGRPLDAHDRHVRFQLPDAIYDMTDEERQARNLWTAPQGRANLVALKGLGSFVRTLIPVHLVGGDSVTFGAWLAVDDETWARVIDTWWAPEYSRLEFEGTLANAIAPWGDDIAGAHAKAAVRDQAEIPWVAASDHPKLARLLRDEWPAAPVLGAWRDARR